MIEILNSTISNEHKKIVINILGLTTKKKRQLVTETKWSLQ